MPHSDEQRIRQILYYSPAIIYACRAKGDFGATYVSDNVTALLGYSIQECLDDPNFWRDRIHADDRARIFSVYDDFFARGHHIHEYRFRKKDGNYLWVRDELRLVRDTNGDPVEIIGSWIDISERKKTESALQKSEALFRDFFISNPVATIISSPSGFVHMVNPAFTESTDYSAADVIGRNAEELGFWQNLEDRQRMVAAIRERGFIDNLESTFYGKSQKLMTCLISSRAIEYEGELSILSIVTDVTEKRLAEESLRKLDQAKSDFISMAAHELRTPLIAVVGYCELLENAASLKINEQQKNEYLAIIQSQAEMLNRLVNDLLDVGRIQVGRPLGVVRKDNDLSRIIEIVVAPVQRQNPQHEIVIIHQNPLPKTLMVDAGRITQVFSNLLDNAVKYSPHGGVIEVRTKTCEDKVEVSISDQGKGMTPSQVEHVFDRFYRAESSMTEISGLGLGMNIVRQIIDEHDGEIVVTSKPGEGTSVTFTLPIQP